MPKLDFVITRYQDMGLTRATSIKEDVRYGKGQFFGEH